MYTSHKNILIPISQSLNTRNAVTRAMTGANPRQTTIHLVCLMRSWNPFILIHPSSAFERMLNDDLDSYLKALLNMMHWKDQIEKNYSGITVRIHLKKGFSWQSLMHRTIRKVGSGTIVFAAGQIRHWLGVWDYISLHLVALQTGCKILSIKSDAASGLFDNSLSKSATNHIPSPGDIESGAFCLHSFNSSPSHN
jgi:hypothetical protein